MTRILHSALALQHSGHSRVSFFKFKRGCRCSVPTLLWEDNRSVCARDLLVSSVKPKVFASSFEIHLFLFGLVSTGFPPIALTDFSVCTYGSNLMDFNYTRFYTDARTRSRSWSTGKYCKNSIAPSERVRLQLVASDTNITRSHLRYLI